MSGEARQKDGGQALQVVLSLWPVLSGTAG